jgi:cytochrome c biogenesis protein CcmG/thiol:disulfide interchange protein DsbE
VEKVQREFKDREVQFIGIFVRDSDAAVRQFVKTYGLTFPVGLDDGVTIAGPYGFVGTPYTVIVSKDGQIIDRHAGPQGEQALRHKIEKLLK